MLPDELVKEFFPDPLNTLPAGARLPQPQHQRNLNGIRFPSSVFFTSRFRCAWDRRARYGCNALF